MKRITILLICTGIAQARTSHILRHYQAKQQFQANTGHPTGYKGYVVDRIVPLSKGGADAPSNMQWIPKAQAKEKAKWE